MKWQAFRGMLLRFFKRKPRVPYPSINEPAFTPIELSRARLRQNVKQLTKNVRVVEFSGSHVGKVDLLQINWKEENMGYTVQGTNILHNGHTIQLHGVNVIGMELENDCVIGGLWVDQGIPAFFDQIKEQGFNVIRFPIGPRTLRNVDINQGTAGIWQGSKNAQAGLGGMKSLDFLKVILDYCDKIGIRYIFDHHYLEDGAIPPLWYTARYSEVQWLTDLQFIAREFKGRAGFVGIDIKNEPNGDHGATWGDGNPLTDWKLAAEKAHKAIAEVNSEILTIVEWITTNWKGQMNKPLSIPDDKLLLSCHVYGPSVWGPYTKDFDANNFPSNMRGIWDDMWGALGQYRAMYVGEWGGKYKADPKGKDNLWQDALVNYGLTNAMAGTVFHHTHWGWGENSGWDTGGILADGSYRKLDEEKLKNVQRLRTPLAKFSTETLAVLPPIPAPKPEPAEETESLPVAPDDDQIVIDQAPEPKFKVGAIVCLLSGSPQMIFAGPNKKRPELVNVLYYDSISGAIREYGVRDYMLVEVETKVTANFFMTNSKAENLYDKALRGAKARESFDEQIASLQYAAAPVGIDRAKMYASKTQYTSHGKTK